MSKNKSKKQVMLESTGRLPHIIANLWGNNVRNQEIDVDRIYDLYKKQPKKYVKSKYDTLARNNSTTAHTQQLNIHTCTHS